MTRDVSAHMYHNVSFLLPNFAIIFLKMSKIYIDYVAWKRNKSLSSYQLIPFSAFNTSEPSEPIKLYITNSLVFIGNITYIENQAENLHYGTLQGKYDFWNEVVHIFHANS